MHVLSRLRGKRASRPLPELRRRTGRAPPPLGRKAHKISSVERSRRQAEAVRLIRAGVLTAVVDGLFSTVLVVFFYQSSFTRLFQGVAGTVAGPRAIDGGPAMTTLGVLMHIGVAFAWSGVFLLLVSGSSWLRSAIRSRGGLIAAAAVYGPCVWVVMSLGVIPLLTGRPPAITTRWWIQFVGHAPFVGLPIVASIAGA
jgi:hypothetical protein